MGKYSELLGTTVEHNKYGLGVIDAIVTKAPFKITIAVDFPMERKSFGLLTSFNSGELHACDETLSVIDALNKEKAEASRIKQAPFIRKKHNVNSSRIISNVFHVPFEFRICPVCGKEMRLNYVHAIPFCADYCVIIQRAVCDNCNAIYSPDHKAIAYLQQEDIDTSGIRILEGYYHCYSKNKTSTLSVANDTLYKRIVLASSSFDMRIISVVAKKTDERILNDVYHYTNVLELLIAVNRNESIITFDDKKYAVERCITNSQLGWSLMSAITDEVSATINMRFNQPELSSSSTLYVYRGNIRCNHFHHVVPYKAEIEALDRRIRFLVHYCYNCQRFIMKYDDYSVYLKRYKFFPLRIQEDDTQNYAYYQNRALYSPLYLMGYNVNANNALPAKTRQSILAYVMECRIMTQREVLNYLEMFIHDSENRYDRAEAVSKWTEDKKFVLDYKLSTHPEVIIGKLMHW